MARRASAEAALAMPGSEGRFQKWARYSFWATLVLLVCFGCAVVFWKVEHCLINDPRFLVTATEPGERSESFQVEGQYYAAEEQIVQVFQRDFGRSLYVCPIAKRRLELMGIDWIKD